MAKLLFRDLDKCLLALGNRADKVLPATGLPGTTTFVVEQFSFLLGVCWFRLPVLLQAPHDFGVAFMPAPPRGVRRVGVDPEWVAALVCLVQGNPHPEVER